jgi:hypothetical protein
MGKRSFGALAAASLLQAGILAQEMPKPAPELSQIAYFEGSWSCQGKMSESPMGPAGEMQSTADIKKDLGGFWQSGLIKGTMKGMPPMEGRFHATYDPAAKQFVMLWVDNMGGWAQSTSGGWKGDTIVYEGETHMGPQKMRARDTFTRSGPGSMKHAWEAEINGKWTALGEETCKKK